MTFRRVPTCAGTFSSLNNHAGNWERNNYISVRDGRKPFIHPRGESGKELKSREKVIGTRFINTPFGPQAKLSAFPRVFLGPFQLSSFWDVIKNRPRYVIDGLNEPFSHPSQNRIMFWMFQYWTKSVITFTKYQTTLNLTLCNKALT